MRARLLLLALLAGLQPAAAQFLEGGGRVTALGGAGTALRDDAWAHANPATWSTLQQRQAAFFASEAFGLDALRLGAVQVAAPLGIGTVALGLRTFGYEAFRDTRATLGFARSVRVGTRRALHVGVSVRYVTIRIAGYGQAGTVGVSVGGLMEMLPVLDLGFHAGHVNAPRLAGHDAVPRTLSVGLAYRPRPTVVLLTDAFKDVRYPLSLRVGAEVWAVPVLALRVGATTAPARLTAGAGVRLGRLRADVAAERHHVLGWSPAAALAVTW